MAYKAKIFIWSFKKRLADLGLEMTFIKELCIYMAKKMI